MRLDALLLGRRLFPSRARAQGAIAAGLVRVAGKVVTKPSTLFERDAGVDILGDVHDYVSRGAQKLEAALTAFGFDPKGQDCLDLGASTGGFTEVLLRRGASSVYAVDVGRGQLHPRIASDPRVISLEGTHARDLDRTLVPAAVGLIVCDVSFIGLRKALPASLDLARPGAALAALVKPQFELGPERIGRGGVVRATSEDFDRLCKDIADWLSARGWAPAGAAVESPILGGDGAREFLVGARRL